MLYSCHSLLGVGGNYQKNATKFRELIAQKSKQYENDHLQGQTREFNLGGANIHIKYKICNLHIKCNIYFLRVTNLYNFAMLVADTTINLKFLNNFRVAVVPN